MDLYNDSANYAIKYFKKQFLYDEIEAEVRGIPVYKFTKFSTATHLYLPDSSTGCD